ncbi:MAG: CehA/McbA family metallohydrolase [Candidatus Anammoximicrobium sp.]|nr:CehA/McbA family metallohydrolase [Candidatus Anammoximicrobium sp.]
MLVIWASSELSPPLNRLLENLKMERRTFLKRSAVSGVGMTLGGMQEAARAQQPAATVKTGKIKGIFVVAPSTIEVGKEFDVSLKMLTDPFHVRLNAFTRGYPTVSSSTSFSFRFFEGNGKLEWHYRSEVPDRWLGTLQISSDSDYRGPSSICFADVPGPYPHDGRPIGKVGPIQFTRPGVHFITFRDPRSGVEQISNPIYVKSKESPEDLYWGDIHGHTLLTDGVRSPEEYYYFGRDEAFLDICALSDHPEFYLTDPMWHYLTEVTNAFNEPGRFVTLQAFEWTHHRLGHRCLYFPSDKVPCIRSDDPEYNTVEAMYRFTKEHAGIAIPHHSATRQFPLVWSNVRDTEIERLVEVYSLWGTSERPVGPGHIRTIGRGENPGSFYVDAMKKGLKLGLIASSDMHIGQPGHAISHRQNKRVYGGLMGVWADKLDRAGVFDAMWNRRVYGTTGTRTILQFSMGNRPMGSTIEPSASVPVKVYAAAEVLITRAEIVYNGDVYKECEPNDNELTWEFAENARQGSYYVRIMRQDAEEAWSSPVWVEG